jgi:hypothetical protein
MCFDNKAALGQETTSWRGGLDGVYGAHGSTSERECDWRGRCPSYIDNKE